MTICGKVHICPYITYCVNTGIYWNWCVTVYCTPSTPVILLSKLWPFQSERKKKKFVRLQFLIELSWFWCEVRHTYLSSSRRSVWPAGSTSAGPVYSSELWAWRRGTCGALKVASAAQQRAGLEGSVRAGSALWPVWFWETREEGDESQHKHVMSWVNVRKCMTGSM